MAFTLCVNCENAPGCLWKSDRTILCNEFLISPAPDSALKRALAPGLENIIPSKKSKGLCDSCTEQTTCILRPGVEPIQYCEEFNQ